MWCREDDVAHLSGPKYIQVWSWTTSTPCRRALLEFQLVLVIGDGHNFWGLHLIAKKWISSPCNAVANTCSNFHWLITRIPTMEPASTLNGLRWQISCKLHDSHPSCITRITLNHGHYDDRRASKTWKNMWDIYINCFYLMDMYASVKSNLW